MIRIRHVKVIGTRDARMALRPAAPSAHKQVGRMAAPTSNAKQLFTLANGGPSTHRSLPAWLCLADDTRKYEFNRTLVHPITNSGPCFALPCQTSLNIRLTLSIIPQIIDKNRMPKIIDGIPPSTMRKILSGVKRSI